MSFNHLANETIQQIADDLSSEDAINLSATCTTLRAIGLRSALRKYAAPCYKFDKFIAFAECVLSKHSSDSKRATYLRSLKLYNPIIFHSCSFRAEWAQALIRLLQDATSLREFSICYWQKISVWCPAIGTALSNARSLERIELHGMILRANAPISLHHFPSSLHTLCLAQTHVPDVGYLPSLLAIIASLPHLHTLELKDVSVAANVDMSFGVPHISLSVRRLVVGWCCMPIIPFVRTFPNVRSATLLHLRDILLLDMHESTGPSLPAARWEYLESIQTDAWFADLIGEVATCVKDLRLDFPYPGTIPGSPSASVVKVWQLCPDYYNYASRVYPERDCQQWMVPAVQTIAKLNISHLQFHFAPSDTERPVRGTSKSNSTETPRLSERYFTGLICAARMLPTLQTVELLVNGGEMGEIERRSWRL
ncbi:uncharacterized protein LAESUDRAFT_812039 [Laetiporus sulphureus 93-53]|uniref:F-box domain-containing protein n=1 Tax=Laetiporus sulphureus 93-53 TaxID=1314785 RepID=A0A165EMC7_9APHY|nr:uncharacterized protein LAESUDRAFT_812039 [Laetiporus sulphureus 93-53]KZT07361.1 hypothetical protein LAESUDRAFT_812039 [Laetiporus sulphureus 93-53]